MASLHYNDIGTLIQLNPGIDVTEASSVAIKYQKPSGVTGTWTGVANGTSDRIEYTTEDGDLNESGTWRLQAYVNGLDGWTGHGDKVKITVRSIIVV